jgi:hypothetical protein
MAVIYNPGIVTSGLVLCLDAANRRSYPETRSTWTDLISSKTVTFYNGVNTSSVNYISFDGLNDMGVVNNTDSLSWTADGSIGSQTMTIDIWIRSSDTTGNFFSRPWNGSGEYNFRITPSTWFLLSGTSSSKSQSFGRTLSNGSWTNIVCWTNSTTMGYNINFNEQSASTSHNLSGNLPSAGNANLNITLMTLYPYGTWVGNESFSILGDLSSVKFYNRVLSSFEIEQNFNAMRGRYGI